jgi:hypothetical protein
MRPVLEALAVLGVILVLGLSWREDATCATDTECADMFGGNGDPEPVED